MADLENEIKKLIEGKNILVTGGTGSIGSQIVRSLLTYDPKVVRILSNSENELFSLQGELGLYWRKTRYLVGDVRDKDRLLKAMKDIDYVFHAAALKHVPLCDYNPLDAILTNVIGTNNVIEAAVNSNVKKLINISTDKAVNPVNTMGACKLLGEKLISSTARSSPKTIMYSVRFGNVLGSRGSIIPTIKEKILKNESIPITDENMTRFIMTIPDAVKLVMQTILYGKGGEIFVLKMKKVKIIDLINVTAEYFCKKYNKNPDQVKIAPIGKRIGEKLSEALITLEEIEYSYETKEMILVPPHPDLTAEESRYSPHPLLNAIPISIMDYDSNKGPYLTKGEIRAILDNILSE
jgi:FlaA1/EpsC-like NDP-sugar epimerase